MKKVILIISPVLFITGWLIYAFIFDSVTTINLEKDNWEWAEDEQATLANDFFWEQFHLGNYDSIPAILERLTNAYISHPNDLQTTCHLGFTHFWALSENKHLQQIPGTIIDHAVLAQKYLGESYKMNPHDVRLLSFLASAKMIVGSFSQDQDLIKDGYFNGLKSIRDWQDFGEFSLAYSLSRLPHTDANFKKALEWMENTTTRCYCEDIQQKFDECTKKISKLNFNPEFTDRSRIIPNSWVAPHNIEGYFMFYGDLLVKAGDWEKGKLMYEVAKHSPDYQDWPYQEALESRILHAKENVEIFRIDDNQRKSNKFDNAIMVNTSISCRACHQMSNNESELKYARFNRKRYITPEFYFLK